MKNKEHMVKLFQNLINISNEIIEALNSEDENKIKIAFKKFTLWLKLYV